MKLRLSNRRNDALTMIEVLVIMLLLFILAMALFPTRSSNMKSKAQRVACTSNLKQIGIATHDFAASHNGKFAMEVSVAAGGTREITSFGVAFPHFLILSNGLATPRVVRCPSDKRERATNFD